MKLLLIAFTLLTSFQVLTKDKPNINILFIFNGVVAGSSNEDFDGIVKLSGCSGSLVKFKGQDPKSLAMIFTNDHCLDDHAYLT